MSRRVSVLSRVKSGVIHAIVVTDWTKAEIQLEMTRSGASGREVIAQFIIGPAQDAVTAYQRAKDFASKLEVTP